ncbi:hypothetical protein B0H19DRAFT_1271965 [Mycena capillaripes]|nr:hypothetical protein B0H19DRAFT_1271965 [Mycena capillaripes]
MCLLLLCLCGHTCWQYNPDLRLIFPSSESRDALDHYIESFIFATIRAETITEASVTSVSYCRTRGLSAYPFLIVRLEHSTLKARPILLKLQGFDGPLTERKSSYRTGWDDPDEGATLTVAGVNQYVWELVGTWRYDVYHTMKWKYKGPSIVDLLVLAELSTERDRTRAVYPTTLFLALRALFKGVVKSTKRGPKSAPLLSDVVDEAKDGVVGDFPARRQRMKELIALHVGPASCRGHLLST